METENIKATNDIDGNSTSDSSNCKHDDVYEETIEDSPLKAEDESSPCNVDENASENETTPEDSKPKEEDRIELVAIPFIMDGSSTVQLFYKSIFRKDDSSDAIFVAEKYFFECFDNDEKPKWDGVYLSQYNFTKNEVVNDERNGIVSLRDFKAKWLWRSPSAAEKVTFNVKCTMPKVWAIHFQSFLKEMENYGKLGHSGQISFFSDGDGNFRPNFKFSTEYGHIDGLPPRRINSKAETMFDAG
jgi:hypothetical protein